MIPALRDFEFLLGVRRRRKPPNKLVLEKVRVRARSSKNNFVFVILINQTPIALDVAGPISFPWPFQPVIVVDWG
jgi:hypothetical protein